MTQQNRLLAVFPGTFDPLTLGHLDLIRRGAALFEELIVAVGDNPDKASMLSAERRTEIVRDAVSGLANVRVARYTGLTVDFARRAGAKVLLRGLRGAADLSFEVSVAQTNRQVSGIETVFLLPAPACAFISSRLVRQIARQGGDVSLMVPPEVLRHLPAKQARAEGVEPEATGPLAPRRGKKRRQGRGA